MHSWLTIQIVGWNSAHQLKQSLPGLTMLAADEVRIHYLDNASEDDSLSVVKKIIPRADSTVFTQNRGFAGAHNYGFARCETPYVLVLNPDVQLDIHCLKRLRGYFDDPAVAAVQGVLLRPGSDPLLIDSAGIVMTAALNGKERGFLKTATSDYQQVTTVDAVSGACGMYRLEALRSVAYRNSTSSLPEVFDTDFFAYKEDIDLGWRLRRRGWTNLCVPVTMGYHNRHLASEGIFGWSVHPKKIYRRLRDIRTRYSIRNWIWMIVKNVTWREELLHEIFIDSRLLLCFAVSLLYPPLLTVWVEIVRGLPVMLRKRTGYEA